MGGCDDIWDCIKDKSKDAVDSATKEAICRPASALIDNLKDTGYANGKNSPMEKKNRKQAAKDGKKAGTSAKPAKGSELAKTAAKGGAVYNGLAAAEAGMKINGKGKVSQKSTDRLGDLFYKAYECKTASGSSANDSQGKYDRRRMARTY